MGYIPTEIKHWKALEVFMDQNGGLISRKAIKNWNFIGKQPSGISYHRNNPVKIFRNESTPLIVLSPNFNLIFWKNNIGNLPICNRISSSTIAMSQILPANNQSRHHENRGKEGRTRDKKEGMMRPFVCRTKLSWNNHVIYSVHINLWGQKTYNRLVNNSADNRSQE